VLPGSEMKSGLMRDFRLQIASLIGVITSSYFLLSS
jgi:hypothetical protein